MDEQQMRAECARIAAEWHAGGLAGGSIYEDFAVELAKVAQAAERERWREAGWVCADGFPALLGNRPLKPAAKLYAVPSDWA